MAASSHPRAVALEFYSGEPLYLITLSRFGMEKCCTLFLETL